MARPLKVGLEYFPLDCQMDDKVEMLEAEHGLEGFAVYIKLLQAIYQTEAGELDMSIVFRWKTLGKTYGISPENLRNIVSTCLEVALFDRDAFENRQMLTSEGVQKRLGKVASLRQKDRSRKSDVDSDAANEFSSGKPSENATKGKGKGKDTSVSKREKETELNSATTSPAADAAARGPEKKIGVVVEKAIAPPLEAQREASHTKGGAAKKGKSVVPPELLPEECPLARLVNPGGEAERVQEVSQPLTYEQADKLITDYSEQAVRDILCQMANWKPLLTKCQSVNLTARNWLGKRATDAQPSSTTSHVSGTRTYPTRSTNGAKPTGNAGQLARSLSRELRN